MILIGQTDHAKLSGQCAAHWGNHDFARPKPYEAVVRAAMFHDSGWYDYEASPTIAPDTGKPLNFMQVTWGKPQRRAFEWAIDWMTGIDPYSGLLREQASHRAAARTLRQSRAPEILQYPEPAGRQRRLFGTQRRGASGAVAQLRRSEFWTNYRLLQAFDLISLFLCNKDVVDDYIEPVPTSL